MDSSILFYFIRHGQTEANARKVFSGSEWDVPLNEIGISQAQTAAQNIFTQIKNIKTICVSPLKRAQQTAQIINSVLNVPIITIDELKEWGLGDWTAQPVNSVPDFFTQPLSPPNGEPHQAFHDRVALGFNKVLQHCSTPATKPTLIVAHGMVWRALCVTLKLEQSKIPNCTPVEVHKENGIYRIELLQLQQ